MCPSDLFTRTREAQSSLKYQIKKLDLISSKLADREIYTFKKACEAKKLENNSFVQKLAAELWEIRTMRNMVIDAKPVLEKIHSRLETIGSLSNGGCLLGTDLLKEISKESANYDMKELGLRLKKIMQNEYGINQDQIVPRTSPKEAEILSIVDEVNAVFEERACHITMAFFI